MAIQKLIHLSGVLHAADQQQNVVEAAPQHVDSSASTYSSMAGRSGCARWTSPAVLHLDDAQLHLCWNRPLACSSCEQASGCLCVSRPLGASARLADALGGVLGASLRSFGACWRHLGNLRELMNKVVRALTSLGAHLGAFLGGF